MIYTWLGANRCSMVSFGGDLVLGDLLGFYSGLVRSEWVCFGVVWCLLVWFGVVCTFLVLMYVWLYCNNIIYSNIYRSLKKTRRNKKLQHELQIEASEKLLNEKPVIT